MVKETGKKFWSTKDPGQQPFSYNAGVGQVIITGFVENEDREEEIIDYFSPPLLRFLGSLDPPLR